ncbi:beta-lactamase family protein [SAR202 cluster bacterium AC-409-J13_OGT_754m]|nr:beta-lactamase family protein [SAR202 cluster bacterium AC-409-J13_OGT_754m]
MKKELLQKVLTEMQSYIGDILLQERVVGCSIGVVLDQELIWVKGYGYSNIDKQTKPQGHTLFRGDSNTKPFTAMSIMQLRDEGKLDINDPVIKYIPEFGRIDCRYGSIEDVTLRRLLTHRSGLQGEPPSDRPRTGIGPTEEELLNSLHDISVVIPPDWQHKYCNLGFMLLGVVVSRLSGIKYEDYIDNYIFSPLGMIASTFNPDQSEVDRVIQYYGPEYQEKSAEAMRLELKSWIPAGGIYSNIDDMAKWISLQFRTDNDIRADSQILKGTSIEEMHRPQYLESDWSSGLCISWHALRSGDNVYLGHGGSNAGSNSQTYFNKRYKVGVIVFTNSDAHSAHNRISKEIMDHCVDTLGSIKEKTQTSPTIPAPSEMEPLIGRYATDRPHSAMRIVWLDGTLMMVDSGQTLPTYLLYKGGSGTPAHLVPTENSNVFMAREGRLAGESISFEIGPNGKATGFIMQTGALYKRIG